MSQSYRNSAEKDLVNLLYGLCNQKLENFSAVGIGGTQEKSTRIPSTRISRRLIHMTLVDMGLG
jgi:hypothetical protein